MKHGTQLTLPPALRGGGVYPNSCLTLLSTLDPFLVSAHVQTLAATLCSVTRSGHNLFNNNPPPNSGVLLAVVIGTKTLKDGFRDREITPSSSRLISLLFFGNCVERSVGFAHPCSHNQRGPQIGVSERSCEDLAS